MSPSRNTRSPMGAYHASWVNGSTASVVLFTCARVLIPLHFQPNGTYFLFPLRLVQNPSLLASRTAISSLPSVRANSPLAHTSAMSIITIVHPLLDVFCRGLVLFLCATLIAHLSRVGTRTRPGTVNRETRALLPTSRPAHSRTIPHKESHQSTNHAETEIFPLPEGSDHCTAALLESATHREGPSDKGDGFEHPQVAPLTSVKEPIPTSLIANSSGIAQEAETEPERPREEETVPGC